MARIAELVIRARTEGLAALGTAAQAMRALSTEARRGSGDLDAAARAQQALGRASGLSANQQRQYANELVRTARQSRDFGLAQAIIAQELRRTDNSLIRTQQLLRQQVQVMQQAERSARGLGQALPRTFAGFTGRGILEIAGAFGIATTAMGAFQQTAQRAMEGLRLGAALDQNRRAIGTLLGDVERGNDVFQRAIAFGRQYGFTQQDMGVAAQQAATLIRNSTVETERALGVLGRLLALNPAESFSGAAFAVRELATGDYISIADRFNLGKQAARELRDEVAAGRDVFEALDERLTRLGITTQVLQDRVEGTAGSLRRSAQAGEDFTLALGDLARSQGVVEFIEWLTDRTQALTTLLNAGATTRGFHDQILAGAQSYEEYGQKLAWVNAQLPFYISKIQQLAPAQYAAAQSLMAQGVAANEAARRVSQLPEALQGAVQHSEALDSRLQAMLPNLILFAVQNSDAATAVQNLLLAYADTGNLDAFVAQFTALQGMYAASSQYAAVYAGAQREVNDATRDAATILAEHQAALRQTAAESALAGVQAQELAIQKERLEAQARRAADALIAAGSAGAGAAATLAASSSQVDQLTAAYYRLAMAQQAVGQATNQYMSAYSSQSRTQTAALNNQARQLEAIRQAEANLARVRGGDRVAYQQELAALGKLKPGTAAYINQLAKVEELKQRIAKADATAAGRAGSAANKAASAAASAAAKAAREQEAALRDAAREAEAVRDARRALMNDEQRLVSLRQQLAAGGMVESERLRLVREIRDLEERIADRRFRLMDTEQQLATLRARQAEPNRTELERAELAREILNLEQQIRRERLQAAQEAINAELRQIQEVRTRRDEERELQQARRVIASRGSSAEQRQFAELRVREIELQRQQRALEAGGDALGATAAAAMQRSLDPVQFGRTIGQQAALAFTTTPPTTAAGAGVPAALTPPAAAPITSLPAVTFDPRAIVDAIRQGFEGIQIYIEGPGGVLTPAKHRIALRGALAARGVS